MLRVLLNDEEKSSFRVPFLTREHLHNGSKLLKTIQERKEVWKAVRDQGEVGLLTLPESFSIQMPAGYFTGPAFLDVATALPKSEAGDAKSDCGKEHTNKWFAPEFLADFNIELTAPEHESLLDIFIGKSLLSKDHDEAVVQVMEKLGFKLPKTYHAGIISSGTGDQLFICSTIAELEKVLTQVVSKMEAAPLEVRLGDKPRHVACEKRTFFIHNIGNFTVNLFACFFFSRMYADPIFRFYDSNNLEITPSEAYPNNIAHCDRSKAELYHTTYQFLKDHAFKSQQDVPSIEADTQKISSIITDYIMEDKSLGFTAYDMRKSNHYFFISEADSEALLEKAPPGTALIKETNSGPLQSEFFHDIVLKCNDGTEAKLGVCFNGRIQPRQVHNLLCLEAKDSKEQEELKKQAEEYKEEFQESRLLVGNLPIFGYPQQPTVPLQLDNLKAQLEQELSTFQTDPNLLGISRVTFLEKDPDVILLEELVSKGLTYFEVNNQEYPYLFRSCRFEILGCHGGDCDILSIPEMKEAIPFDKMPFKSNSAYIYLQNTNSIVYVNKLTREWNSLRLINEKEELEKFHSEYKPTKEARTLSQQERFDLENLLDHTGSHFVHFISPSSTHGMIRRHLHTKLMRKQLKIDSKTEFNYKMGLCEDRVYLNSDHWDYNRYTVGYRVENVKTFAKAIHEVAIATNKYSPSLFSKLEKIANIPLPGPQLFAPVSPTQIHALAALDKNDYQKFKKHFRLSNLESLNAKIAATTSESFKKKRQQALQTFLERFQTEEATATKSVQTEPRASASLF